MTKDTSFLDLCEEFLTRYYRDEIGQLAQRYPKEQRSLVVDWLGTVWLRQYRVVPTSVSGTGPSGRSSVRSRAGAIGSVGSADRTRDDQLAARPLAVAVGRFATHAVGRARWTAATAPTPALQSSEPAL